MTDRGSLVEFLARVSLFEHLDHRDRTRLVRLQRDELFAVVRLYTALGGGRQP